MTNEEMLEGLLASADVQKALTGISMHGSIDNSGLAAAIPDYYTACAAITRRLFEMRVHEDNPLECEDNANAPYLILGNLGSVPGAGQDMVLHLCFKAGVEKGELQNYVMERADAGNRGEPNLIHGIMNMDAIGHYLSDLKSAMFLSMLLEKDEDDIVTAEIPHPFSKELH